MVFMQDESLIPFHKKGQEQGAKKEDQTKSFLFASIPATNALSVLRACSVTHN